MGHTQPTIQTSDVQARIKDLACRAVKAVGINVGPAHVEMILTKQGPKMVELGARMGGDCITTHLVPLSTGIDMVGTTIKLACGENIDIEPKFNKGAAIRYFETKPGILKRIEGIEKAKNIPGVIEISFVHDIGDTVGEIGSSTDRIGFVIAQAETRQQAIDICEQVINSIKIDVVEV
jgi:biotin carboxylase